MTLTREERAQWREDLSNPELQHFCTTMWRNRTAALLEALDAAEQERDSVQFALDGYRGVAARDNEYLIARAERAEAALARVRALAEEWESAVASLRGLSFRDLEHGPDFAADLRAALAGPPHADEGGEGA